MEWQLVAALVVAVPVILFPAAFVWNMNIGGIIAHIREARQKRAARKQADKPVAEAARHLDTAG